MSKHKNIPHPNTNNTNNTQNTHKLGRARISPQTLGMWLAVLGVAIFAITLPMTRLATGSAEAPALSPWFVTWGRAVLAGVLSAVFLVATRSPWPSAAQRKSIALAMLGNALGYPLLLGLALRHVSSGHAAVFTALLPLATAAVAAWVLHQRAGWAFWACSVLGAALVCCFALLRAAQIPAGLAWNWADLLLLGAILCAAMGYVHGAKITPQLGAERVICWVCAMTLPLSVPGALLTWPAQAPPLHAWLALGYLGVFSMWAGFFAWYRGLALGGALHVSQIQLLQPFLSILAAVPLLSEHLEWSTLGFALAVATTVFWGKRFAAPSAVAVPTMATVAPPISSSTPINPIK
jgi:drug/metabolite transporter (DMT)-like permease